MNGILGNFHKSTREISFDVKTDSITIKNHIDNEDNDHEAIRSNYTLRIDEFDTFSIKENCSIAFTYADFRAMCHFAEASEAFVRISFEAPGEPLCMSCRDQDLFVANLLMATMLHDMEDTGQDVLQSNSGKSRSQTDANIDDTDPKTVSSASDIEKTVKRKRRVIDTQSDDNPFNFMQDNVNPEPEPEIIRNRKTVVNDRPSIFPSFVPDTSSSSLETRKSPSHVSPTTSHDLFFLNKKSSLLVSCPPYPRLTIPEEVQNQAKESEEIFFETEDSEPKNDEVIIPETDESVPNTPPSAEFLKRRRYLFARCFEKTFDLRAVPGANEILAPNSDEEG